MKFARKFTKFREISYQDVIITPFSHILARFVTSQVYYTSKRIHTSALFHTCTAPGFLILTPGSPRNVAAAVPQGLAAAREAGRRAAPPRDVPRALLQGDAGWPRYEGSDET